MQIEIIETVKTRLIVQVTSDWPDNCQKNIGEARKHLKAAIEVVGLDGIGEKKEKNVTSHIVVMDGIEI